MFFEEAEEGWRIVDAAFQRIRAEKLAPTPDNYTLWYAYYSRQFPDLSQAIDGLARSGLALDDQRCAELHQRFFGIERERVALRLAGDRLVEALGVAVSLLGEAGGDAGRYGDVLSVARRGVSLAASMEQLQQLVRTVADETSRIAERNRSLQSQLGETTHTIEDLRRDLDSVRRENLTDALTGIGNRKRFDQDLNEGIARARDSGTSLSLLMMDIDLFKHFNDTNGHVAGDQVLKLVARTIADNVPEVATTTRYGGEEFAVILPRHPLQEAVEVGERIRLSIATRQIVKRTTGETMGRVTLSVGVAQYINDDDPLTFVRQADAALYRAKGEGRNRVVAATDPSLIG